MSMEQMPVVLSYTHLATNLKQAVFSLEDLIASTKDPKQQKAYRGLLQEDGGMQKPKFSILQFIWLELISDLKQFRVSDQQIGLLKGALFSSHKAAPNLEVLTYYTLQSLVHQIPVYIVLNSKGEMMIIDDSMYKELMSYKEMGIHICISLQEVLSRVLPLEELALEKVTHSASSILKYIEELLTDRKIKEIHLYPKSDKIIVETKERVPKYIVVEEFLKREQNNTSEIIVKTYKGKVIQMYKKEQKQFSKTN